MKNITNILLVEDNYADADLISEQLHREENFRHRMKHCLTLSEAVEILRTDVFDVILLDLNLPDSSGIDTVRETINAANKTPIIVLTGNIDEESALVALENGAQDYLIKGQIFPSQLPRSIRYAIQRTEIQETVKSSEFFLKSTLDGLSAQIAILTETGEVISYNKAWATAYGSAGHPSFLIEQESGIDTSENKTIRTAINDVLQGNTTLFETQFLCRNNGHQRWLHIKITPFPHSLEKKVVISLEDITETTIARQQLAASEKKYRTIINNIKIGVALITDQHTVLELNHSMKKWFPDFPTNLPNSCGRLFCSPSAPKKGNCPIQNTIKTGIGQTLLHKKNTDQYEQIFKISTTPLVNSLGQAKAVIMLAEDITENIELDRKLEQAQKMEAIGNLAGGIAHDFNNILSAILGYSDLAKSTLPPNSTTANDIQEVIYAGRRATELVKQILSFSRQTPKVIQAVDLQDIINESLSLLRSTISTAITIQTSLPAEPSIVLADPTQLHQVVMNLCTNAYQAMPNAKGVLTITLKNIFCETEDLPKASNLPRGDYVQLHISDTGAGISDDILSKIFEPYFTTKQATEGTGLGLSVVHGIVKSFSGDIDVHSTLGKGSVFQVYLPRSQPSNTQQFQSLTTINVSHSLERRIMVIDDEMPVASLCERVLTQNGFKVKAFSNSRAAMESLESAPHSYDLVLTDMNMPEYNGLEVAQLVFSLRKDLPVIISTGYSEQLTPSTIHATGVKLIVHKPLTGTDLITAVKKVLGD